MFMEICTEYGRFYCEALTPKTSSLVPTKSSIVSAQRDLESLEITSSPFRPRAGRFIERLEGCILFWRLGC